VSLPSPIAPLLAAALLALRAEDPAVHLAGDRSKPESPPKAAPAASVEELSRQLREPEPGRRRSAVRALAKLSQPAAWRLVVEALADTDSGVADAAQLALEGALDPTLWKELLGRAGLESKDAGVAKRVAEALGRARLEFEGDVLAKALTTRDERVERLLLSAVEQLSRANRIRGSTERLEATLMRAHGSRGDVERSCAALVALAQLGGKHAQRLALDALRDDAPQARAAACIALAHLRAPQALTSAIRLAADEDPRVRLQALETLELLGTRDSLFSLVARLGEERQLRLRWRIVDLLQSASGMKHRLDPRPWKLWIETLPPEGVVRRPSKPAAPEAQAGATRAGGFAGLQLLSDRVCFLFDFSGSMWTPLGDGRTPKDIVAEKLEAALEALPPETEFNLIPFTNEPLPWSDHALPATPKHKQQALEFFVGCRERGRGNFFDAALLAASDPRIDTLCVLTDGVPTGGVHSDMDVITPLFVEATRFRRVVVDSILVDAPSGAARRWAELARLTGGRSIEIELKEVKPEAK